MRQILCFGDSNTWGLDGDSGKRLPWGVRWTSLLQEKLGQQYHVIEEGLCGRTTIFDDPLRDGRRGTELLPILLETHATVDGVVLMLGTNDCKTAFGASAEVIGKGIERLLRQIRYAAPQAEILLISRFIWEIMFGDRNAIRNFRKHLLLFHSVCSRFMRPLQKNGISDFCAQQTMLFAAQRIKSI